MHQLVFADNYWKLYKQKCGRNRQVKKKVVRTLKQLAFDPKHPALKAHKAATRRFGEKWAVRVTGDLRIIWDYSQEKGKILVLGLGGHSGKKKVYR